MEGWYELYKRHFFELENWLPVMVTPAELPVCLSGSGHMKNSLKVALPVAKWCPNAFSHQESWEAAGLQAVSTRSYSPFGKVTAIPSPMGTALPAGSLLRLPPPTYQLGAARSEAIPTYFLLFNLCTKMRRHLPT